MHIVTAQYNATIGDLDGNAERLLDALTQAEAANANALVTPEMALTGYPPKDLLDRPDFLAAIGRHLRTIVERVRDTILILGSPVAADGDPCALEHNGPLANGAIAIQNGRIIACHRKMLLPTYDVFDERRYFIAGSSPTVVDIAGTRVALTICEDLWRSPPHWDGPRPHDYDKDPATAAVEAGAEVIFNLSASPFDAKKPRRRADMLRDLAATHGKPILYVNQIGAHDALIFDGRSLALNHDGAIAFTAPAFGEDLSTLELKAGHWHLPKAPTPAPSRSTADEHIDALVLGIRDYARKCGFQQVVVGLSGGIDSAVTAALATQALGPERVIGITMPSRYSSDGSVSDSVALASNLGITLHTIPIEPIFAASLKALEPSFSGREEDVTEENLQARIRGLLLMAHANKFNALLLTTGNKSELAVGYCTLYGDMCGGLAVISDLYKTEVYAVAERLNARAGQPCIPIETLTKPPSAELRPDQRDDDTLPPYEVLDELLRGYVDKHLGPETLVRQGHDAALVRRVLRLVDRAEYKRRQMPPGLRLSSKAFGEGRRMPIAQKYSW